MGSEHQEFTHAHSIALRACDLSQIRTQFAEKHIFGMEKWLRKSEQGDKWNRCLIEGMIVLSETGARDEQTTPP